MAIFPKSPCSGAARRLAFGPGPDRRDPAAMLFNSWSFAIFLPLVFLVNYLGRTAAWQLGDLTGRPLLVKELKHKRWVERSRTC